MNRPAFSLLELIVAISVLGLIVGIVAVAPIAVRKSTIDPVRAAVAAAVSSGRTTVTSDSLDGMIVFIAADPSGVVVTDTTYTDKRLSRTDSSRR